MHYYRVSKYSQNAGFDPTFPASNEWTSIADVGNVFNGIEFTMQEYVRTEKEYIEFVADVMKKSNIKAVKLAYIEARGKRIWRKNKELDITLTCKFVQDCLREYCWGQIIAENFIWEAGYDFYTGTEAVISHLPLCKPKTRSSPLGLLRASALIRLNRRMPIGSKLVGEDGHATGELPPTRMPYLQTAPFGIACVFNGILAIPC